MLSVREGALLIGNARAVPHLKHPGHKAKPTISSVDSVSFDAFELCGNQTGDEAVKALSYYLGTMVSHLKETFEGPASAAVAGTTSVVLTGVITSVPDALDNHENATWELLAIENHVDTDNVEAAARELLANPDRLETVLLHPKSLSRFTGVYPGVVVRIRGTVYKSDLMGTPTSVGVDDLCLPSRPPIRWPAPNTSEATNPTPARVHFVAGPYTRNGIFTPLEAAVRVAAQRGANAIVMYGPFVPEVPSQNLGAVNNQTFDDSLNQFFDAIEAALHDSAVANSALERVFVVPSLDDITSLPILPQPKLAIDDTAEKYKVVSNPCAITVAGVTFKCANVPSVDDVSKVMAERWHNDKRRLLRAGESVLRDRLLAPLLGFPAKTHDMRWLSALALMDDLEMDPPHAVVFPTPRDNAIAFLSHSDQTDLSDPEGDGALVLMLPTAGRVIEQGVYNYDVVEVTMPDALAAATGGLGGGRATVTVLHETCPIDFGV